MDEAVVTTKLKRAHEYTNDLTEMRGLSKAEYVSEIANYSHSTSFVEILNSCLFCSVNRSVLVAHLFNRHRCTRFHLVF